MCAPVKVDQALQKKIEADTLKVLEQPQVRERLTRMGVDVEPLGTVAFTQFFKEETERWAKVARVAGVHQQ